MFAKLINDFFDQKEDLLLALEVLYRDNPVKIYINHQCKKQLKLHKHQLLVYLRKN